MNTPLYLLTISHVTAGIISLIVAPIALIVLKGGNIHRLTGKIFFWAMTWIFLSAIVLSVYKSIPFLLMIAVFSYYAVFIGYRSIYQKQLHKRKGVKWYDWLAMTISGCFNIGFVTWGILLASKGEAGFLAYLAIVFGIGGVMIVAGQLKSFVAPSNDRHAWLYSHIGNMIGGFIASVTAFSTQVMVFLPGLVQWIWPALIGVPLISYWISSYRRKLANNEQLVDLVQLKR